MAQTIAEKLKELRQLKGFSQEHLASISQLNLRTVQRIESGQTEPRGDSLNRLASALGIAIENLTSANITAAGKENTTYLQLMNLLQLLIFFYFIPGLIAPLVIWLIKREEFPNVNSQGRKILNFQLTWCIICILVVIALFTGALNKVFGGNISVGGPESILVWMLICPVAYSVYVLFNTIRIALHKKVWYYPAVPFFRNANPSS